MKMILLILIGLLMIPIVLAVIKDYTIITCRDVGCEIGTCKNDGYCYDNGNKYRRSCVEVPESCLESEGRLCYTGRPYPVCVFVTEQEIIMRDKEEKPFNEVSFNFQNKIIFGDKKVISSSPDFICSPQGENWNFPQPSRDCWKTSVSFAGESYTMNDGDEVDLNDYLSLKLGISGHYDIDDGRVDSYANTLILTIKKDFINLNQLEDEKYFVVKDSKEKMCFNINNQLANFNQEQAGFYVTQYNDILGIEKPRIFKKNEIKKGDNIYCIGIDTSMYGEIEYEIFAYTSFGDNKYFDNENLLFRYKIVDEENIIIDEDITGDDDTTTIGYTSPECIKDEECNDFNSKTRDSCVNNICINQRTSYLPFVILSLFVLLVIFLIGKRR